MEKYKYRTFWKRFAAGIIDGTIFALLYYLLSLTTDNGIVKMFLTFAVFVAEAIYSVFLHGKYGQTIGKKILDIKVYDLDEENLIGFKRAFYRDSIWIILEIATFIYAIITLALDPGSSSNVQSYYEDVVSSISLLWFIAEFITMLFNYKGRAVHDYLAKSVVIAH